MTYKHKDHMEWLLQKTDYYTENAVTEERIQEIREVYAKAKAWDDFVKVIEEEDLKKVDSSLEALANTANKGRLAQYHKDKFKSGEHHD